MKRSFFQAAVVSILLYGCTTWTLTKRLERKLDGNYTRMLRAVLNKSWRQHPTRLQLYGHLPPITKTIQVRRTRHAGHCWRSKDELISDVLLWTPTYGRAKPGRPARTYIQQLCEDTGCNPEDLPEAMNDREKWRERVRDIRAGGATRWWWWWNLFSKAKSVKFNMKILVLTDPSTRTGSDIRSILTQSITGLSPDFSFSLTGCLTKVKESSLPYYLPIGGRRITGFIPFPRVLAFCEMQSATSRLRTRVAVFISYNDNLAQSAAVQNTPTASL